MGRNAINAGNPAGIEMVLLLQPQRTRPLIATQNIKGIQSEAHFSEDFMFGFSFRRLRGVSKYEEDAPLPIFPIALHITRWMRARCVKSQWESNSRARSQARTALSISPSSIKPKPRA